MTKTNTTIITLIFFLITTCVFSQSAEEQAVATAVESLRKAMVNADKTALSNLTAEDLSYGHSNGTLENKATFIEVIMSGKNDYSSIEISNQTIEITGNTALVRHKFVTVMEGSPNVTNLGVLNVWQKQKGKWKLLARQAFKL
jgi:ketosteroid isomerase-like protein